MDWPFDQTLTRQLALTVALIVVAILLRSLAWRFLRGNARMATKDRLRWGATARTVALSVVVLGLLFIWAEELQGFALSMVAVAAAFAIASKELLMCISGSFVRSTGRAFEVGDRVELAGVRGDVIDTTLLSTTLLEIGPGHQRTGRSVVFPNSVLLTEAVVNETFTQDYVLHVIDVPIDGDEWMDAEARLLEVAKEVCGDITDEARSHMDAVGRRHGLSAFSVAPRVSVQVTDSGRLGLLLRVPTRARDKGRVEQMILRRFFGDQDAVIETTDPTSSSL